MHQGYLRKTLDNAWLHTQYKAAACKGNLHQTGGVTTGHKACYTYRKSAGDMITTYKYLILQYYSSNGIGLFLQDMIGTE